MTRTELLTQWAKRIRETPDERFDRQTRPFDNGCVLWTGAVRQTGYGQFALTHRKSVMPHRYAYERAHGPIPMGMVVMHSCDTPLCVNVAHLSVGTPFDNKADSVRKRRHAHGVTNGRAKLNENDVRAIRQSVQSCRVLAREFGVVKSTISFIKTRKLWAHVA